MKAIALVLSSIFFPLMLIPQSSIPADLKLRSLDAKIVTASSLFEPGVPTVVIFWDDSNPGILDEMNEITDLVKEKATGLIRIIAIYEATSGNYGHVKPMIYGSNLEADIYIDLNGELSRAMSIPDAPALLLYNGPEELAAIYRNPCICFPEMTSKDMLAVIDGDKYFNSSYNYFTK